MDTIARDMTRRDFMWCTAQAGLTLAVTLGPLGTAVVQAGSAVGEPFSPSAWLVLAADGTLTVLVNKSEMGQGVFTSLPMIVADEMEADWKTVRVEAAPAADAFKDPEWQFQGTGGSTSIRHMYSPLRKVGASARVMLVSAAARAWSVEVASCVARSGKVYHEPSGRSLGYGELADRAAREEIPQDPPLKARDQFRYVGRSLPRLDIPEKVAGTARFGADVTVQGLLYGAVVLPPAYGAKPVAHDAAAAKKVPGTVAVVPLEYGVGVVANSQWAAWKAAEALEVTWSPGTRPDLDTVGAASELVAALEQPGNEARSDGDVEKALARVASRMEALYELPYLAHATMEPMACTAEVRADGVTVWSPTQNQTYSRQVAAQLAGFEPEAVDVVTTYLGTGFGRKFELDLLTDAVSLSKAVGKPVKVIRTREDDIGHDFYRPGCAQRVEAGVDAEGMITGWSHKTALSSIMTRVFPDYVVNGVDPASVEGITDTPYILPNFRVHTVNSDLPVPVGFWRSVGGSQNAFVMECFMDELAHTAGRDPLQFRLSHLTPDSPARALLTQVAEAAGWRKPRTPGRHLGIAQHHSFGSWFAHVAEVSVDDRGRVRVHRIWAAVDCGIVVHPDTVVAQVEGATIMGVSMALKEKFELAGGGAASENFHDYEILRIDESPEIDVILAPSGGFVGGIGEPGLPPTAPAIANAVFAATGARVRTLPLTAGVVRAAMDAAKG